MPRAVSGTVSRHRRKKMLGMAKGFRGSRSRQFQKAKEAVEKSLVYAYRDRRAKKRDFRCLWIARINAAVRSQGLTYSKFMHGLKLANIELNRKNLSELAINNVETFNVLMATAKTRLAAV